MWIDSIWKWGERLCLKKKHPPKPQFVDLFGCLEAAKGSCGKPSTDHFSTSVCMLSKRQEMREYDCTDKMICISIKQLEQMTKLDLFSKQRGMETVVGRRVAHMNFTKFRKSSLTLCMRIRPTGHQPLWIAKYAKRKGSDHRPSVEKRPKQFR